MNLDLDFGTIVARLIQLLSKKLERKKQGSKKGQTLRKISTMSYS